MNALPRKKVDNTILFLRANELRSESLELMHSIVDENLPSAQRKENAKQAYNKSKSALGILMYLWANRNQSITNENLCEVGLALSDMLFTGELAASSFDQRVLASKNVLEILAIEYESQKAREVLNERTAVLYERYANSLEKHDEGPLRDFDGNLVTIREEGIFTPVDATLSYEACQNVLRLSLNLSIINLCDYEGLESHIIAGVKDWEGEYLVFGNQRLNLEIKITSNSRLHDSVFIILCDTEMAEHMAREIDTLSNALLLGDQLRKKIDALRAGRAFASIGVSKWSIHSTKTVFLFPDRLTNPTEIRSVMRHEFGHVLGLGDMYQSPADGYPGTYEYQDIEAYRTADALYASVMCDNSTVTNNDIEMVVLALSSNRMQLYQSSKPGDRLSEALGKGN